MEMNTKTKKTAMIAQIVFNSIFIIIMTSAIFSLIAAFKDDMGYNITLGCFIIIFLSVIVRLISRIVLSFRNLKLLREGNEDILMEKDLDDKDAISIIGKVSSGIVLVVFIIIVLWTIVSFDYDLIKNWDGSNNSLYTISASMLFVIACIYIIIRKVGKK